MLKKILPVLLLGLTVSVSACNKNESKNEENTFDQPASLAAEKKSA